MGAVSFTQTPTSVVDDSLLHKLVRWRPGTPYHQDRIERLRETLQRLDYFFGHRCIAAAGQGGRPRGAGRGHADAGQAQRLHRGPELRLDSGAGVRLGVDRRYLNRRGQQGDRAARLRAAAQDAHAAVPHPGVRVARRLVHLRVAGADEQTDFIDNRRVEFLASRSGRVNRKLEAVAGLHVLRERWAYAAEDDGDPSTPPPTAMPRSCIRPSMPPTPT